MSKGGARARSGPAPDPNALRRERDDGEWVSLPAEGRTDPPPAWPLEDPSAREVALWRELWSMPQALMWERQRQFLEVALYVRRLAEAEQRNSSTSLSTLVRQMSDSLGLTTPGMRSNRWRVVADEVAGRREPRVSQSARDRFRVVNE